MQPIDIQRVRGELKWDGMPGERIAAKVVCIRQESERRIANLATPEPNAFRGLLVALPIGILFWAGVLYAIRIVWVRP